MVSEGTAICGVPIRGSKNVQFVLLGAGALMCGVGLSTLQERVFKIPGFSYGGWMTFVTYVSWVVCGSVERAFLGATNRKGSLKGYALVSTLTLAGVYFTNWSLVYLNYATRIVVKSCKVLPVMVIRVLVQKKSHSALEYCAVVVLVGGISMFTLGDKEGYPEFSVVGFLLIGIALVCDALTSNFEEAWFFGRENPCSHSEVVYFLSIFSSFYGFLVVAVTGELLPAARHSLIHTEVVPLIFMFSVLGYLGVEFVLLLIKTSGATNTEIVKSLRRVLQVCLSFFLFPKPFVWKHAMGGAAVVLGLFWFQQLRVRVKLQRKNTPDEVPFITDDSKPQVVVET
ncbi:hypothetical protein BSKO_11149 [Bryopsis sp. KO-2023]|nr:hypothetical protein BSKO_11149 [Bryopsis sp. KO-2023]